MTSKNSKSIFKPGYSRPELQSAGPQHDIAPHENKNAVAGTKPSHRVGGTGERAGPAQVIRTA